MLQQDYSRVAVRSSAILTNSYVAGTVISGIASTGIQLSNQLTLYINFTLGSLTNLTVKLEFSDDGTNYFQETSSAIATGVSTESLLTHVYAATGKYRLPLPIKDRYIKVSVLGTGTVTNSLVDIVAIYGVV